MSHLLIQAGSIVSQPIARLLTGIRLPKWELPVRLRDLPKTDRQRAAALLKDDYKRPHRA